jgi:hypothetical protein
VPSLVEDIAEHGSEESSRGVENRNLHLLLGQAIARILGGRGGSAPGGKYGTAHLKETSEAFRGDNRQDGYGGWNCVYRREIEREMRCPGFGPFAFW